MATLHLYGGARVSEKPTSFRPGMHGRQFHVVGNFFPSGARRDIFPLDTDMVSGVKEMALPKSILIKYPRIFSYRSRGDGHKYCFVFLDTSISYMFDLIDALGSHYRLPFRSRNNIPHIIFHDGLIIFDHGIFPNLMNCCLSMTRRLNINDISHI
jgi:hypothetical protein